MLLIARLIQGVAAGIQMPQVLGLIQQLFQGKERAKAFGLFGAMIGIATAFGPTLGGLLIAIGGATDGWRAIFWMNLPLGVDRHRARGLADATDAHQVETGGTARRRRCADLRRDGHRADVAVPVHDGVAGSDDPARWWLLVVFVLALAGFIAWERRYAATGRDPLVPLSLFSISSYRNGTLLVTVYFAALPSAFLLTTLYLQQGLGLPPVFAGMVTIGFALTSALLVLARRGAGAALRPRSGGVRPELRARRCGSPRVRCAVDAAGVHSVGDGGGDVRRGHRRRSRRLARTRR